MFRLRSILSYLPKPPSPPSSRHLHNIAIMDGGTGTLLKHSGAHLSHTEYTTLWSAAPLTDPSRHHHVVSAHTKFIQAGANMITSNTYACTLDMLSKAYPNMSLKELTQKRNELAKTAMLLAKEAVDKSKANVKILASIPPLSVSYRPDLVKENDGLIEEYSGLIETISPYADVLLCETMSSLVEAKAAVNAAKKFGGGVDVWCSYTVDESGDVRDGTEIVEAVKALNIDAALINCGTPEACLIALKKLNVAGVTEEMDVGVLPNGYVPIDASTFTLRPGDSTASEDEGSVKPKEIIGRRKEISDNALAFVDVFKEYAENGAKMVGGCCDVMPEHIRAFRIAREGFEKKKVA